MEEQSQRASAPRWSKAVFALLCLGYVGLCFVYWRRIGSWVIDDAFIIFRYADNFAAGDGLVYNRGEAVEGYTSFTWTLLVGVLTALKLPIIAVCQALGVVLGVASLALTWIVSRRLLKNEWRALFVVALVASNRSAAVWASEPLETKLFGFALLCTAALWQLTGPGGRWRRIPVVGLAAAFLALTRPEGFAYVLFLALAGLGPARRHRAMKDLGLNAATFLVIVWAHLVFRLVVYDAWVPNTFAAKVTGIHLEAGARYVATMADANGFVLYGWLVPLGLAFGQAEARSFRVWSGLVLGFSLIYWLVIGGDYFEFRFLEPLLPFWSIAVALGIGAVGSRLARGRRASAVVLSGVALTANVFSVTFPYVGDGQITSPERETQYTRLFVLAARWLATNIPPDEVIAIRPAGAIAYLTRLHCIDTLGLNDREIATMKSAITSGPAGHRRQVSMPYLKQRGASYYVGHPVVVKAPARDGSGYISAEVAPGRFLLIGQLDPNATLGSRTYAWGTATAPLTGWEPVEGAPSVSN